MFSAALAEGGFATPDPPALDMVFVVLGEVFSQLCQENPRTCRGQSRESKNLPRTKPRRKSVRTPSGKLNSFKAFFFQTPFLIATLPTPKTLGGGTPPRGASIRRPSRVGVLNSIGRVLPILPPILLPHSSSRRFLSPPPKSSPSSLGPTPSAAAKNGAGASWRLLGRKNRVPRGLQKLIKF